MFTSPVFLSGGHKPRHADEGGGTSRFPLISHDTGQQFPAAVCGRRSVERGEQPTQSEIQTVLNTVHQNVINLISLCCNRRLF